MRWVKIGTTEFEVQKYTRASQSLMVPRQDISGTPGAENLEQSVWLWSLTDFSGGEGNVVWDKESPSVFARSNGGVDNRVRGQAQLSPVPTLVTTGSGTATTRFEGNTLSDSIGTSSDSGTDTLIGVTETRIEGSALTETDPTYTVVGTDGTITNGSAKTANQTPAAGTVTVIFRVKNSDAAGDARLYVKTAAGVTVTSSSPITSTAYADYTLSFTADGTTSYYYEIGEVRGYTLTVDYIDEWVPVAEEVAQTGRTPGAVAVTVAFRFVGNAAGTAYEIRVRNTTDATDVTSATGTVTDTPTTQTLAFSGTAGKTYSYFIKKTSATAVHRLQVDYIEEQTGAALNDARALVHGYNDDIWTVHWDGTNSDVYRWDFTNSDWDSIHSNLVAQQPVALAASDRAQYGLFRDNQVWAWTGAANGQYADAPTTANLGNGIGIAVANNRLYTLFEQALFEITLDSALASSYAEGTANYTLKVAAGNFYNYENEDRDLRQQMCGFETGVRFFINVRGGPTTIYEFSDGALSPIGTLPQGYKATAIHHYGGITFIGVQFVSRGSTPNKTRAAIYYIDQPQVPPKFLGHLRYSDPDDQPVRSITSYGHDVFFLQGNKVWRYDTSTGGLTQDYDTGASDDTKARGIAVMDRKLWVAYEGQGVFVTSDAYPTSQTVYVEAPIWDFDVPDLDKVLESIDITTAPLPANTSVTVEYQTDESGSWTSAGTMNTTGATKQRLTVSSSSSTVEFRTLKFRLGLATTAAASTPTIRSVTARASVVKYQKVYQLELRIDDDTSTEHLPAQQLTAKEKGDLLDTLVQSESVVSFEDHFSADDDNPADFVTETVIVESAQVDLGTDGTGIATVRLRTVAA